MGMRVRVVLAGLALAIFMTATGGDLPYSPYADALVLTAWALAVFAYGWQVGLISLWLFPVLVVTVAVIASVVFFEPDSRIGGMDRIGDDPAAIVLMLPVVVPLLGIAVLVRRRRPRKALPA